MMNKNLFFLFITLGISLGCTQSGSQEEQEIPLTSENSFQVVETVQSAIPPRRALVNTQKVKNVIFFIADGTGIAQLHSGQLNVVGKDGRMHFQTMPVTGLVSTHSTSSLITDSAAGATAYSCGKKTDNGMIAQLPDGTNCKTVLEFAQEKGMSTALISTSGITHATPASYASHIVSRRMEADIAAQYVDSNVDVFLGGGEEFFIPSDQEGSRREDTRNLKEEFAEKGYDIATTASEMHAASGDKIVGLFASGGLTHADSEPTLAEMTAKALSIVEDNDNGFFMMIEGSQIDWGGHDNDAAYVVREVKSFDAAVKEALDFAEQDGETLVIITADHETGGMALTENLDEGAKMRISWPTDYHTAVPIPLMAYGPRAIEFTGWWDNTEVGKKVADILNIQDFPANLEK